MADLVEKPALAAGKPAPKVVILSSAYREFFGPFLKYVKTLSLENPKRTIAVMVPELVERKWYHFLVRHRATLLKGLLLLGGGPQVAIVNTPWYLGDVPPAALNRSKRFSIFNWLASGFQPSGARHGKEDLAR